MSQSFLRLFIYCWLLVPAVQCHAAAIVAAADSLPQEKARADLVCDGKDDQQELAASLAMGRRGKTQTDASPKTQQTVECTLNHAVEWLPGTYHLSATLEVPSAANCVIRAEGTTLHCEAAKGDCVVIRGMNRCRYSFGTIESSTKGAALCIRPPVEMPAIMSFVNFAGLIGKNARGTGLLLDPTHQGVCANRIEGTDILGFDKGVVVRPTAHKCDTNWFWLSYIRMCNTCVEEASQRVDDNVWQVNVDASLPNSVAIRAGGAYGKWYVIMGTFTFEKKNKALVLEPGTRHSVFEMHPPIGNFAWEDRSGNDTNVILTTDSPPHRRFSELRLRTGRFVSVAKPLREKRDGQAGPPGRIDR